MESNQPAPCFRPEDAERMLAEDRRAREQAFAQAFKEISDKYRCDVNFIGLAFENGQLVPKMAITSR